MKNKFERAFNMKEEVKKIISENVEELTNVELTDDLQLITSGYIDSFDIITIINLLEKKFCIEIDLDQVKLEEFNTVDSICQIIKKYGV